MSVNALMASIAFWTAVVLVMFRMNLQDTFSHWNVTKNTKNMVSGSYIWNSIASFISSCACFSVFLTISALAVALASSSSFSSRLFFALSIKAARWVISWQRMKGKYPNWWTFYKIISLFFTFVRSAIIFWRSEISFSVSLVMFKLAMIFPWFFLNTFNCFCWTNNQWRCEQMQILYGSGSQSWSKKFENHCFTALRTFANY